jgi:hypothetical protein
MTAAGFDLRSNRLFALTDAMEMATVLSGANGSS